MLKYRSTQNKFVTLLVMGGGGGSVSRCSDAAGL